MEKQISKIINGMADVAVKCSNNKISQSRFVKSIIPVLIGFAQMLNDKQFVLMELAEVDKFNAKMAELEKKIKQYNVITHGTYCGDVELLVGEDALLRPDGNRLFAQFDNLTLDKKYNHAWVAFDKGDFKIDEEAK
jgi:hypothetical protein